MTKIDSANETQSIYTQFQAIRLDEFIIMN